MTQDPSPSSSAAKTPSKKSPAHRSKLRAFFQLIGQLGEIVLAFIPLLIKGMGQLVQLLVKGLKWLQQWWTATLPKLRTILPSWSQQLPDWLLTGIAIGFIGLLVALPIALRSDRSTVTASDPAKPHVVRQYEQPDPNRLLAIRTQLGEVTDRYGADLLQAVQLRFAQHNLILSVSDVWLTLSPEQQEQLANDLLQRSRKLSFSSLEICDLNGKTLARNPVVGSKMVLFAAANQA